MERDIAGAKALLENTANPNVNAGTQVCGGTGQADIPNKFGYGLVDALGRLQRLRAASGLDHRHADRDRRVRRLVHLRRHVHVRVRRPCLQLGPGPEGDLNTAYRCDPATDTWTTLAPDAGQPGADVVGRYYLPTNSIYVFGGAHRDPNNLPPLMNNVWIYNIAANTWSAGPPLPDVRAFMASGYDSANGKI